MTKRTVNLMKMKTIKMTRVYLNNWYQYEDEIINIGDCTLFTGGNQTGKSTALDAIKYCFNGDTNFNVASEVGKRTLIGYTRCLLSNTTNAYKRNMPTITTQIAIEFFNPEKNAYFINGACIRTTESPDTLRYQLPNKRLEDLLFKELNSSGQYEFLPRKDFGIKNNIEFEKADEGNGYGLDMIGLDIHDDYTHTNPKIQTLRRVINSIIAYQPKAKIDDFIRNNVLPANPVDLKKVSKITDKIESIQKEIDEIVVHQQSLQAVVRAGETAKSDRERYDVNIGVTKLETMNKTRSDSERLKLEAQNAATRLQMEEDNLSSLNITLDLKKEERLQIKQSINENGGSLLTSYQTDYSNKETSLKNLEEDYRKSIVACEKVVSIMEIIESRGTSIAQGNILRNLHDINIKTIDKLNAMASFKILVTEERDKAHRFLAKISNEYDELSKYKRQISNDLITLNRHNLEPLVETGALNLRNIINKEFEKQNIPCKAKLLFENIIGITDETWRNALEAYLGGTRFHVLVPARHYDIAFNIFKGINGKGTLIKTNLLEKKDVILSSGSIVELISVEENLTKKYLQYLYGRVLRCDEEGIKTAESGLTKTGILSSRLSDKKINLSVDGYCLGKEAFQINIDRKTLELQGVEQKISVLENKMNEIHDYISSCNTSSLENISYEINILISSINQEMIALKQKIERLESTMKSNTQYFALLSQQNENKEQIRHIENLVTKSIKDIQTLKNASIIADRDATSANITANNAEREYTVFINNHSELVERIIKTKLVPVDQTVERNLRLANESEKKFFEILVSHDNKWKERYGDTYSDEVIAKYKDKANELEIRDIVKKKQNLEEQHRAMNHTFKTEFVTAIANSVSNGVRILNDLSMKLKTLDFSSEYSFKYRDTPDDKMCAILKLGDYQKESINLLFSSEEKRQEMEGVEKELEEYLKEIINKNDNVEMERLSDYRQYMTYDLEIQNEKYGDKKVSLKKEIQTESGAGTQIPYLIILAASLMTVYDKGRPDCARLMLIDEPFEKMGEENVNIMMHFLKNSFQIIMCAPDTQLRLLSSHCDQLNTVYIEGKGHTRIYGERKL